MIRRIGFLIICAIVCVALEYFEVISFVVPSLNAFSFEQIGFITFINSLELSLATTTLINIFAGVEIFVALVLVAFKFLNEVNFVVKALFMLPAIYLIYDAVSVLVTIVAV